MKGSAVATAAIAGLSLVGCQDVKETEEQTTQGTTAEPTTGEVSPEHSAIVDIEEGGKWVSAACWHNCGGRCMNKVMVKDGAYVPLVTITDEDIKAWGVEGTAQEGIIGLQEIIDNGGYQVERTAGDDFSKEIGYAAFIADPAAAPLSSASGKFEICCQAKADLLNSFGFSNKTYAAYPEYIVPELGYETTFKNGDIKGEKGEYPYLLYNPHYIRRSHTVFNNCPWLREAWPNPVYLNASDAKAKGIKNGDTVKVWTKYGEVLRKACCMEGLMPGQVGIPHGSWVNVDEKTGIDMAGADNYLIGTDIYGMGVTGYNNCNCNYEKYDGPELEDDCYTDSRIIDLD